ncbi:uncharacterized protein Gasu_58820 [Galdieria sulphuraria]|uniref:Serine/threonine-protein phosphatase 4 regulatory subunit 3-like central domain-containing protein n=1 Tax=Galdieria sulphuraria TaxID=130081 RepID=M2XS41_GALSU|nr:uncharacterized protein Gasu_58820 [Galdieria sulphuraria]EME26478.1 hypothetical protein Gasu_58820 [Galdieria sulphuraria]|eukprot:XP_005702998.1 hypothetical protein Gasu_58820 [Galdieria sulphuraria]
MEQEWLQKIAVFQVTLLSSDSNCSQKSGVEVYVSIFETTEAGYYLEALEKQDTEHVLFCTYLDKNEYIWNLESHIMTCFRNTLSSEQPQPGAVRGNDLEEEIRMGESREDGTPEGWKTRNFCDSEPFRLYFDSESEATRFWSLVNKFNHSEKEQLTDCRNERTLPGKKFCSDSTASQQSDWHHEETKVGHCLQEHADVDNDMFLLQTTPRNKGDHSEPSLANDNMEDSSVVFTQPDLSNLDSIELLLKNTSSEEREQFLNKLKENPNILEKFIYLFHICEDLKLLSKLKKLSNIIYSILISGNSSILELLLSDSYYYDIIGILEYRNSDVSMTGQKAGEKRVVTHRVNLRKYLRKLMNMEDLVTFHDAHVAERVRLNQRLMFLKQNFFPILSEDHMLTVLNSVMFFNNLDIINYFRSSPDSLNGLFETLKDLQMDEKGQKKEQQMYPCAVLRIIYELCDLCKAQQQHNQQNRERFFVVFRVDDLLAICSKFLMYSMDFQERFFCANIILILLTSFSSPVREYILRHVDLFKAIVIALKREDDFALSSTLSDIICMLIDPDTTKDFLQKDEFLDLFYEDIVNELLAAFDSLEPTESLEDSSRSTCYSNAPFGNNVILAACQSCNILSHCVASHGYRPKYVIWRLNALNKACRLFGYQDTCISLYPLRLVRHCIGQRDEFYNRYIVKENIMDLVFRGAERCASRKNIFYCSLLEMLSFIEKSGMTLLIQYIGKHHLLSSIFGDIPIVQKYRGVVDDNSRKDISPSHEESVSFLGKRRTTEVDSEDRYFEENDDDIVSNGQMEWNVDRDLILPQGNKDKEEDSSVFLHLCESKDQVNSSTKVHKKRAPIVARGKWGSHRPLVDYSWTGDDEPAHPSHAE